MLKIINLNPNFNQSGIFLFKFKINKNKLEEKFIFLVFSFNPLLFIEKLRVGLSVHR